ncbi:hypothetical protein T492DRAFT_1038861 [Pavlovales sp. CCMP2436]|nr:hypothetical protein T492DRAFT_1038861 [Pavlovales sp. CCMP2436]
MASAQPGGADGGAAAGGDEAGGLGGEGVGASSPLLSARSVASSIRTAHSPGLAAAHGDSRKVDIVTASLRRIFFGKSQHLPFQSPPAKSPRRARATPFRTVTPRRERARTPTFARRGGAGAVGPAEGGAGEPGAERGLRAGSAPFFARPQVLQQEQRRAAAPSARADRRLMAGTTLSREV